MTEDVFTSYKCFQVSAVPPSQSYVLGIHGRHFTEYGSISPGKKFLQEVKYGRMLSSFTLCMALVPILQNGNGLSKDVLSVFPYAKSFKKKQKNVELHKMKILKTWSAYLKEKGFLA